MKSQLRKSLESLITVWGEDQKETVARIGMRDVAVVALGGSGRSLLGNILGSLGLTYVDANAEIVHQDGSCKTKAGAELYRRRVEAYVDMESLPIEKVFGLRTSFMRTELPIRYFESNTLLGLWILVRDPRDHLHSLYQALAQVVHHPSAKKTGSFADWLRAPCLANLHPIDLWKSVYADLSGTVQRLGKDKIAVTRFEDLKRQPADAIVSALRVFGLDVEEVALNHAIAQSTYERMREHENEVLKAHGRVSENGRLIRRGMIGEWREWMTPELEMYFSTESLVRVAAEYGYQLKTPQV